MKIKIFTSHLQLLQVHHAWHSSLKKIHGSHPFKLELAMHLYIYALISTHQRLYNQFINN